MNAKVNSIGKYLIPTFTLSDCNAVVFIDKTLQQSGKSSVNFREPVNYIISYPNYNCIDLIKTENGLEKQIKPFGNTYTITLEYLTDSIKKVPRIDIDIVNQETVTSKEYYLDADIKITGYGIYDDFEESVQIKGRGNTTWNYPKKPYRLKFSKKKSPFGLNKGKSWVLLANYQDGSMLCNPIAMKIGALTGVSYTNHMIPVDLYMNGEYQGSYTFTEKVGISGNSVDIDENEGCILEMDKYFDEQYRFKSDYYKLPVMFKEPDLSGFIDVANGTREDSVKFENIKTLFNTFEKLVVEGENYDQYIDMEALARFMLVNYLVRNTELMHPKSTYLWKRNIADDSKFIFGPLWDFDYSYGYSGGFENYFINAINDIIFNNNSNETFNGNRFFYKMMQNELFCKYYYKVWNEFMQNNSLEELFDYIENYYEFAQTSINNDAKLWERVNGYDTQIIESWLEGRANYIYKNLEKYDITDITEPVIKDSVLYFVNYNPKEYEYITYIRTK